MLVHYPLYYSNAATLIEADNSVATTPGIEEQQSHIVFVVSSATFVW